MQTLVSLVPRSHSVCISSLSFPSTGNMFIYEAAFYSIRPLVHLLCVDTDGGSLRSPALVFHITSWLRTLYGIERGTVRMPSPSIGMYGTASQWIKPLVHLGSSSPTACQAMSHLSRSLPPKHLSWEMPGTRCTHSLGSATNPQPFPQGIKKDVCTLRMNKFLPLNILPVSLTPDKNSERWKFHSSKPFFLPPVITS